MNAQILPQRGKAKVLPLGNMLNELISDGSEIDLRSIKRHKNSNTFRGFQGEARGQPELLKKPGANDQAPNVLQSSPNVISTSIYSPKTRVIYVVLKQSEERINSNDKKSAREGAAL